MSNWRAVSNSISFQQCWPLSPCRQRVFFLQLIPSQPCWKQKCSTILLKGVGSLGQQQESHSSGEQSWLFFCHHHLIINGQLKGVHFSSHFISDKISFLFWGCHCHRRNKGVWGHLSLALVVWAVSDNSKRNLFPRKVQNLPKWGFGEIPSSLAWRAWVCSLAQNFLLYRKPQEGAVPVPITITSNLSGAPQDWNPSGNSLLGFAGNQVRRK